ncbi:hypothetical protein [Salisediminibacterium selenitireducens]|uniref:Lipoprotein n=1 Tax=Bacillus selenitireducens (strain ATCC 700615 / DSM 15326 / MLS10) TaxID=439292 RepID=D6XSI7_BACIE|nr:hypothetical protein [Salisediminibacterium selenitireducens]ADH98773.1 hypothetical protein Bsel_1261 [[Bacillus] selenitireducens MLS10]
MMKKRWMGFAAAATLFITAVSGCAVSEEQIEEEARALIEQKMSGDPNDTNASDEGLEFYSDRAIDIEHVNEFNYVLSANDMTYLLFKNDDIDYADPNEIEKDLMLDNEVIVLETFTNEASVDGYIVVTQFDEDLYRLIVAVDGRKMTTVLGIEDLQDHAEFMFDFVYSMAEDE